MNTSSEKDIDQVQVVDTKDPNFSLKESFRNHDLKFQTFLDTHKPLQTE